MEKDEPDEAPGRGFLNELLQQPFTITYTSDPRSQQLTHQRISGRFTVVKLLSEAKFPGNYMLVKKSSLGEYAFPKFINSFLENTLGISENS
ncbi:MAG: hypothetical protein H0X41_13160 [Chitinophagaceae bacterium]|nr:hypothetical protein [Chitinophagaceae bacterium]